MVSTGSDDLPVGAYLPAAPLTCTFAAPGPSGGVGIHFKFPVVDSIDPGSPASRQPGLVSGLVLVAIGDQTVAGVALADAIGVYSTAGWPLQLTFRQPSRSELQRAWRQRDQPSWTRAALDALAAYAGSWWSTQPPRPSDLLQALQARRWESLPSFLTPSVIEPWVASTTADAPLHVVLRHRPPAVVVRQLLVAWPGAIFRVTAQGNTALHLALQNGAPADVSTLLLHAWPEAAKKKNEEGMYPLHAAAGWKADGGAELVRALAAMHPTAVGSPNAAGMLPLHCAVSKFAEAGGLVQAGHGDSTAAVAEVDEQIVAALLELPHDGPLAPVATACRADLSMPLHLACANGAPSGTITALVSRWPAALRDRTRDGCLPLHMAAAGLPAESLPAVVDGWPAALMERDRVGGRLPLHVACAAGRPTSVIRLLLDSCPESVRQPTRPAALLPLQLAVQANAPDAVALLATAWPEACAAKANRGVPLAHKAVELGLSTEVISALVTAWPAGTRRAKGRTLRELLVDAAGAEGAGDDYAGVLALVDSLAATQGGGAAADAATTQPVVGAEGAASARAAELSARRRSGGGGGGGGGGRRRGHGKRSQKDKARPGMFSAMSFGFSVERAVNSADDQEAAAPAPELQRSDSTAQHGRKTTRKKKPARRAVAVPATRSAAARAVTAHSASSSASSSASETESESEEESEEEEDFEEAAAAAAAGGAHGGGDGWEAEGRNATGTRGRAPDVVGFAAQMAAHEKDLSGHPNAGQAAVGCAVPTEFCCPISCELMVDPVTTSAGMTCAPGQRTDLSRRRRHHRRTYHTAATDTARSVTQMRGTRSWNGLKLTTSTL